MQIALKILLDHRLTRTQARVLGAVLALGERGTLTDGRVWSASREVAAAAGVGLRESKRAVATLRRDGWLRVRRRRAHGQPVYDVLVPAAGKHDAESCEVCAEYDDNDWPDSLYPPDVTEKHLAHIIEKHLARHMDESHQCEAFEARPPAPVMRECPQCGLSTVVTMCCGEALV